MTTRPTTPEISRVLSHALRHAPAEYGLALDAEGWTHVSGVLEALHGLGPQWEFVDQGVLHEVLAGTGKKRHQIENGRIRAVHGHSVPVQPSSAPVQPPPVLFHGTGRAAAAIIRESGILPMRRQYVHLAETAEQAREVGRRKDAEPVILTVDTGIAQAQGISFYRSDSGVWLAGGVIPASAVRA
ncbi:RNA 2'-phosphotransferase [Arthrobacter sp. ATA002]|uniref:RNA 2'-phosphotransferase n=1 Tax=Arthrobacter sp. ATA002 TaxID=2991715 RepID=UPI0022A7CA5A|nr:RNA 2'-phosphotransferase [Arthrobacter sp. ATA002]WAP50776.1 RNA 2'-phosphotransferase [Arthrobacter sp. ATA002]